MIRKIIKIDKDLCNGCGLCISACHEGAIGMVKGKATLMRDDYCDGLGDCLPVCPTGAITFEQRDTLEYDEQAVKINQGKQDKLLCGCLETQSQSIVHTNMHDDKCVNDIDSQLNQWPVQIKLVSVNAPYLNNANLLIAADCTAYAYGNFHNEYMKNRVTLIGCPKLDEGDYSEKLTAIIKNNDIKSVMVVRMEVPCCVGIENAVKNALKNSNKLIPWNIVTISTDGRVLER